MGVPLDPGTGRASQRQPGGRTLIRGHQERDPRVPDLQASQDHAGPGRPAHLRRQPPRSGASPEEVALLAGVSVDYYTRLERGNLSGVSESVLEALARALQLDEAERAHLFDLARAAQTTTATRRRRPAKQRIRPGVQRILDAMTGAPAFVQQRALGHPRRQPARATPSIRFTPPRAGRRTRRGSSFSIRARRTSTPTGTTSPTRSWRSCDPKPAGTRTTVACRTSSGSCRPRTRRSAPDGRRTTSAFHDTGVKHIHHPVVGDLELTTRRWSSQADTGLTMFAFTAEPGSKSEQALNLLASWSATTDRAEPAHASDEA